MEGCIEFKNVVRRLLDIDNTANIWGDSIIIACDEPQLNIQVIEETIFYRCSFTPFKKKIIGGLFRNGSKFNLHPFR